MSGVTVVMVIIICMVIKKREIKRKEEEAMHKRHKRSINSTESERTFNSSREKCLQLKANIDHD